MTELCQLIQNRACDNFAIGISPDNLRDTLARLDALNVKWISTGALPSALRQEVVDEMHNCWLRWSDLYLIIYMHEGFICWAEKEAVNESYVETYPSLDDMIVKLQTNCAETLDAACLC